MRSDVLQLAGVRFLAAAKGEDAAKLRFSLFFAGLLSALALISFGSVASLASTLAPRVVILGLALSVLQGLTDMSFMVIRVSGRLGTAAILLILRASLLLAGAVAGALLTEPPKRHSWDALRPGRSPRYRPVHSSHTAAKSVPADHAGGLGEFLPLRHARRGRFGDFTSQCR
ncbi:MAG: hypothetical protein WDN50_22380 [Bradyrhizobium sp.]